MASFKCKDIGMKCKFEVKTENLDELMPIIAIHAEKSHNMKDVPPEKVEQIKKAIKK
jgi:predicted small metal-binding protein